MKISDLIPDGQALLSLEPEELAGAVLQVLRAETSNQGMVNWNNFTNSSDLTAGYHASTRDDVQGAIAEAWSWLERGGLLVAAPGSNGMNGWRVVSRRGRTLTTPEAVDAYRRSNKLPRNMLHPRIAQQVWATFLRGDYDTAVFQAFKDVEVAVRTVAELPSTDFGVSLMRKAFHAESGPLADMDAPPAERQARLELFSGAIGSYKNPQSHRVVEVAADECVELVVLASHLLRVVDTLKRRDV
jgi:uncharacterized protein (TIGR02391 family)